MIKEIFLNPQDRELRSGWQVVGFFLVLIILQIWMIEGYFSWFKTSPLNSNKINQLWFTLILRSITLLAAVIPSLLCVRFMTRRPIASLGYGFHRRWIRDLLLGVIVSFVMITTLSLLQLICGGTKFSWQPPAVVEFIRWTSLLVLVFFIAASLEELLFRGFPLQALAKNIDPIFAALLMSVPFGLGHINNPEATTFSTVNTILAGLFLCLAYFKTRSLWLATGLHMGWNFTMGSLYGLPVSGITTFSKYSPIHSTDIGPQWLTGGFYGPEGGISSTIILIIGTIWLYQTKVFTVSPEMARYFTPKWKVLLEKAAEEHAAEVTLSQPLPPSQPEQNEV